MALPNPLVKVRNATGTSYLNTNCSADFGSGQIQYSMGPNGCGAATLNLGLYWDDFVTKTYWLGRNIVEIWTPNASGVQTIRYAGIIVRRERSNEQTPKAIVTCKPLISRLDEAVGSFTINNIDVGTALHNCISNFGIDVSPLVLTAFPGVNQNYSGTRQDTSLLQMCNEILTAVTSPADKWYLYVDATYTIQLLKLYDGLGNSYTYTATFNQASYGVDLFPFDAKAVDEDCSTLYNRIEVLGDTDPVSKQPYRAIVIDATSVGLFGTIDSPPVTNQACKSNNACAAFGNSLLKQNAIPRASQSLRVYIRRADATDTVGDLTPAVVGYENVIVSGYLNSAPNTTGLCLDVQTTIDPGGDAWQDIQYQAVEPDWNEAVKQRTNALGVSIKQNTQPAAYLDQYVVSPGALLYTFNGLVVTTPAFNAIFKGTSSPLIPPLNYSVPGATHTLVASATNYLWIQDTVTWIVKTDPSPVVDVNNNTQAILYAIFQTNQTSVIGDFPKASTGVVFINPNQITGGAGGKVNLIPDSDMLFGNFDPSTDHATTEMYWHGTTMDGTFYISKASDADGSNGLFATSSSSGTSKYLLGEQFSVKPGATYTLSAYIDATGCS